MSAVKKTKKTKGKYKEKKLLKVWLIYSFNLATLVLNYGCRWPIWEMLHIEHYLQYFIIPVPEIILYIIAVINRSKVETSDA